MDKYVCEICEKSYNHKSSLERHKRRHTGNNKLSFFKIPNRKFQPSSIEFLKKGKTGLLDFSDFWNFRDSY